VELRELADQTGWTVAEVMREVTSEYVAKRQAEKELEKKIIWLSENKQLRRPAAQRSSRRRSNLGCAAIRSPVHHRIVLELLLIDGRQIDRAGCRYAFSLGSAVARRIPVFGVSGGSG